MTLLAIAGLASCTDDSGERDGNLDDERAIASELSHQRIVPLVGDLSSHPNDPVVAHRTSTITITNPWAESVEVAWDVKEQDRAWAQDGNTLLEPHQTTTVEIGPNFATTYVDVRSDHPVAATLVATHQDGALERNGGAISAISSPEADLECGELGAAADQRNIITIHNPNGHDTFYTITYVGFDGAEVPLDGVLFPYGTHTVNVKDLLCEPGDAADSCLEPNAVGNTRWIGSASVATHVDNNTSTRPGLVVATTKVNATTATATACLPTSLGAGHLVAPEYKRRPHPDYGGSKSEASWSQWNVLSVKNSSAQQARVRVAFTPAIGEHDGIIGNEPGPMGAAQSFVRTIPAFGRIAFHAKHHDVDDPNGTPPSAALQTLEGKAFGQDHQFIGSVDIQTIDAAGNAIPGNLSGLNTTFIREGGGLVTAPRAGQVELLPASAAATRLSIPNFSLKMHSRLIHPSPSEDAAATFFRLGHPATFGHVTVQNPNDAEARITVRVYDRDGWQVYAATRTVAANSATWWNTQAHPKLRNALLGSVAPVGFSEGELAFEGSVVIDSDQPVLATNQQLNHDAMLGTQWQVNYPAIGFEPAGSQPPRSPVCELLELQREYLGGETGMQLAYVTGVAGSLDLVNGWWPDTWTLPPDSAHVGFESVHDLYHHQSTMARWSGSEVTFATSMGWGSAAGKRYVATAFGLGHGVTDWYGPSTAVGLAVGIGPAIDLPVSLGIGVDVTGFASVANGSPVYPPAGVAGSAVGISLSATLGDESIPIPVPGLPGAALDLGASWFDGETMQSSPHIKQAYDELTAAYFGTLSVRLLRASDRAECLSVEPHWPYTDASRQLLSNTECILEFGNDGDSHLSRAFQHAAGVCALVGPVRCIAPTGPVWPIVQMSTIIGAHRDTSTFWDEYCDE